MQDLGPCGRQVRVQDKGAIDVSASSDQLRQRPSYPLEEGELARHRAMHFGGMNPHWPSQSGNPQEHRRPGYPKIALTPHAMPVALPQPLPKGSFQNPTMPFV